MYAHNKVSAENRIWENCGQEEKVRELRNILELDSLPKIDDQQVVKNITAQFLLPAQGQKPNSPQLLGIGGGPCSGKSFLYEHMSAEGKLAAGAVVHDPDLVMQSIPEYREDASKDPIAAFEKWELPARQLANEILLQALLAGYHIIYMRSFAMTESLNFVHAARTFGYGFDAHIVTCDLDVALTRAKERERQTKRHMPPETLIQRHQAVLALIPEIANMADNYFIYENSCDGSPPELKAHQQI